MSGTPTDGSQTGAGSVEPLPEIAPPRPSRTRWFILGFAVAAIAVSCAVAVVWAWPGPPPPPGPQWQLIVDEHFDRPAALATGWSEVQIPGYAAVRPVPEGQSSWRIEGGALVGEDRQGRVANLARIDLPAGALRATWHLTPLISPLNLNCFVGAPNRLDGYTIHVGGWGRPDYVAVGRAPGAILDACTLAEPLCIGRTYEFSLEFDQGALNFAIDGFQLLSCRDPEPLPGSEVGGLGFEVNWNTLRLDDLRIHILPQPRQSSPLASADALASSGAHGRAAAIYRGFIRSWPDDPLVPIARLRLASALMRSGFADEGRTMLESLRVSPDQTIAVRARYERLRAMAPTADDQALDVMVADLIQARPDPTISRLALTIVSNALFARQPDMAADQVIALVARMRRWSGEFSTGRVDEILARCADRLNQLGRHEDVLSLVPEPAVPNINALLALGRYDEVLRRFPGIQWACYLAWSDTCRYAEGLNQLSEPFLRGRLARESGVAADDPALTSDFDRAFALAQASGAKVAQASFPLQTKAIVFALLGLGQAAEALAVPGIEAPERGLALLHLGRYAEAAKDITAEAGGALELHGCQAIAALASGDMAEARRRAIVPASFTWAYESRWSSHVYDPNFGQHFAAFVLPALIAWQAGGEDPLPAWRELAASQRQRSSLRVDHRWLGLLGAATAASILEQPFRSGGHPLREAALVTAVRADLAGDPAAGERWRAYLQLASPFDVAARAWARLRLQRLGAP